MLYEIVATLGPASRTPEIWAALLRAGVTAFRLNTSHLSLPELEIWLERLEPFLATRQPRPPLILDLQGSKWRLGELLDMTLEAGQRVELRCGAVQEQPGVLPIPHLDFFQAAAASSGEILLDDAKVLLQITASGTEQLEAQVVRGGKLSSNKGVTFRAVDFRKESLHEKDQAILSQTVGRAGIQFALSYVRDGAEMKRYRALIGESAVLAAKVERQTAVEDATAIAGVSNSLWICRGDLGAELGLAAMAQAVAHLVTLPAQIHCPVLMAGQVLEHMTAHPIPTRSEVCYLYDCLRQGLSGFILSDEAAIGQYPVESCQTAALFRQSTILGKSSD